MPRQRDPTINPVREVPVVSESVSIWDSIVSDSAEDTTFSFDIEADQPSELAWNTASVTAGRPRRGTEVETLPAGRIFPTPGVTFAEVNANAWTSITTAEGVIAQVEDTVRGLSQFLNPPPAETTAFHSAFDRLIDEPAREGNRPARPRLRGRERHPRQDTRGDDNRPESYQRPYWGIGYMDGQEFIVVRATNHYDDAVQFMKFNSRHYTVVEFYDGTPGKMTAVWRGDFKRLQEQPTAEGIKGYEGPMLTFKEKRQVLFTEARQQDFRTVLMNRLTEAFENISEEWEDTNMDEEFSIRYGSALAESMDAAVRSFSEDIRSYQREVIAPNID